MRTSQILIAISLALSVSAVAPQQQANKGGFGQQAGGNANAGKNTNTGKTASTGKVTATNTGGKGAAAAGAAGAAGAAASSSSVASAAAAESTTAAAAASTAAAATADNSDAQNSLTLDPKVVSTGFENDGQDVPTAGQVASLTSSNNFINFCLTVPGTPLTNGKQITTGSCNTAPMGIIPSSDNMPSSKFTVPKNGDTLKANTAFTITMAVQNFQTGAFVNAQENYFAAPQTLNANGQIIGHSHVVVEQLTALDQTTPTDPKKFAFFKGLNAPAAGGVLTADVTAGLPAGVYKLSSINSAANHQPVLVPIAQHGSLDDAVYFTVTDDGAAAAGAAGAAAAASTATAAAAGDAAAATATAAASTDAAGAASTAAAGKAGAAASKGAAAAKGSTVAAAAGKGAAATDKQPQQQGKGKRFHARAFGQL